MSDEFRVELDESAMRDLLTGSSGPVVSWVTDIVRQGNNLAKTECPVDTGNLRARHEFTVDVEGDEVVGQFGSTADYAAAVHEGHEVNTSVSHRGRSVHVSGHVAGNPWLERAANRLGLNITR